MTPITHIHIDRDVLVRKDLSPTERMLLALVVGFNDNGLGVSNVELAEILCIHEKSISRLLQGLTDRKIIRIESPNSRNRRIYPVSKSAHGLPSQEPKSAHRLPSQEPKSAHRRSKSAHRRSKSAHALTISKEVKKEEEALGKTTFAEYWNSKENLPTIRKFTPQRKAQLKARMQEPDFAENWEAIIDRVAASAFCTGQNVRGWKADIDWVLKNSTNYVRILEGKYDNKPEPGGGEPKLPTRSPEQAKQYQDMKARMEAEKNVSKETCHVG